MNLTFENIIALGDIHGRWGVVQNHVNKFDIKNTLYIQVGDFGIGFRSPEEDFEVLKMVDEMLAMHNNFLFAIRGNHDDPRWFNGDTFKSFKDEFTNIKLVSDYEVMMLNGENYLFIGGAISIDRKYRQSRNTGWWKDEVVNFDYDFCESIAGIDRMVCHTSPDFCPPLQLGNLVMEYAQDDPTLTQELRNERQQMTKIITDIMKNNKLKSLHYGHFHRSEKFFHKGCEFICCDINEFMLI